MLPDATSDTTVTTPTKSQCTYRCVALPDVAVMAHVATWAAMSQCTYRCVVLPDQTRAARAARSLASQCTYRCVVLPDAVVIGKHFKDKVSMHLQVRGAP